jgi:hypothetical protein
VRREPPLREALRLDELALLPLVLLRLPEPLRDEERAGAAPREREDAVPVVRRERGDVVREVRRDRPESARWSRGISALTSSFTSRFSSASRNLAIRSSSRRIDFASCAVSLSPTSVANVSTRL